MINSSPLKVTLAVILTTEHGVYLVDCRLTRYRQEPWSTLPQHGAKYSEVKLTELNTK